MSGGGMQEYTNNGITVRFDPKVCVHSAVCIRGLGLVFNVKKRPWVNVEGASAETIAAQIGRCPSGALSFELHQPKE
jgi:uncharacterized Fe-S cluster protein YjdI